MNHSKPTKALGSTVFHVGPICIKYYRPHKRLPSIQPIIRLEREIIGARLLHSKHIIVARPWIWNKSHVCAVRRWYYGIHPSKDYQVSERDIKSFANWLLEHRGKGNSLTCDEYKNLAILTHLSMLGIINSEDPIVKTILSGNDLLHADLVPENILIRNDINVVLDSEAVSVGHLAWDAAQLIFFIFSFDRNDARADRFLNAIEMNEADRKVVWKIVDLFAKKWK